MKIRMQQTTVRELVADYKDAGEAGVTGFNGLLDIRPAYQREFVYNEKQRAAVIDTVRKGFPLNILYWAQREDDTFEVMDGQQRTISICQYATGEFSIMVDGHPRAMHNLTQDQRDQILDYELMIYVCEGTDSEKLDWFRTINIAGVQLTEQELRNAVYHGPWLSDAKRHFSRTGCVAYTLSEDYVKGSPIRQELLEKALSWVVERDQLATVDDYMAKHQYDSAANDLWLYFQSVISWAKAVFPVQRKELKSVDWGALYAAHHAGHYDGALLEAQVSKLMADEDVTKKAGIYAYLLSGSERHLSIRAFTPNQKREAFERQAGICPACDETFEISQMHGDHITPWSAGGKTTANNCQMLCIDCNRIKSNI